MPACVSTFKDSCDENCCAGGTGTSPGGGWSHQTPHALASSCAISFSFEGVEKTTGAQQRLLTPIAPEGKRGLCHPVSKKEGLV